MCWRGLWRQAACDGGSCDGASRQATQHKQGIPHARTIRGPQLLSCFPLLLHCRYRQLRGLSRARAITSVVRVVKQQDPETIARLLNALFTFQDSAETIRNLYIGEGGRSNEWGRGYPQPVQR